MRSPHFDPIYTAFVVLSPHFCPKFAYNSPPKPDFDQKSHIGTPPERVCFREGKRMFGINRMYVRAL